MAARRRRRAGRHAGIYACYAGGSYGTTARGTAWGAPGRAAPTAAARRQATRSATRAGGGRSPLDNTQGLPTFKAPAGMTIADFKLTRQLTYRNERRPRAPRAFAMYKLGSKVFAGAGDYDDRQANRLNAVGSWYGTGEQVVVPRARSALELLGAEGLQGRRDLAVDRGRLLQGSGNTPCTVPQRRHQEPAVRHEIVLDRQRGRVDRGARACWPAGSARVRPVTSTRPTTAASAASSWST